MLYKRTQIPTARSVWSACSLLPLWHQSVSPKAAASCTHSKRFAPRHIRPLNWAVSQGRGRPRPLRRLRLATCRPHGTSASSLNRAPRGLAGTSPEPRRRTSNFKLEVLRRGSGEVPAGFRRGGAAAGRFSQQMTPVAGGQDAERFRPAAVDWPAAPEDRAALLVCCLRATDSVFGGWKAAEDTAPYMDSRLSRTLSGPERQFPLTLPFFHEPQSRTGVSPVPAEAQSTEGRRDACPTLPFMVPLQGERAVEAPQGEGTPNCRYS